MHIEIHYLPSIQYISLLLKQEKVCFEVFENYPKQTYRNRAKILTANGVENIIVPTMHQSGHKIFTKDVRIDYSQNWQKQHLGALQAAYGKSAFYEYFMPLFLDVYQKKSKFLLDLNIDLLLTIFKIIGKRVDFCYSDTFESDGANWFNRITPKKELIVKHKFNYRQCFGTEFVGDLSVIDLLMNEGRDAVSILSRIEFEHF